MQVGGPPNIDFGTCGVEGAAPVNLRLAEAAFEGFELCDDEAVFLVGHDDVWEAVVTLNMGQPSTGCAHARANVMHFPAMQDRQSDHLVLELFFANRPRVANWPSRR